MEISITLLHLCLTTLHYLKHFHRYHTYVSIYIVTQHPTMAVVLYITDNKIGASIVVLHYN